MALPRTTSEDFLVHYFAYGSNLLQSRLRARIGPVTLEGVAQLPGYKLTFNLWVGDSGKCDIIKTNNPEDVVWGAVFAIPASRIPFLDRFEGVHGRIYKKINVEVSNHQHTYNAFTYQGVGDGTFHNARRKPYDWYWHHVRLGAFQVGLPAEYQEFLVDQPYVADPYRLRFEMESRFW